MDVKAGLGKVWRVPVAGGLVSLSDADTGLLMRGIGAVAKGLAKTAGGIALAGGLLACLALVQCSEGKEEWERRRRRQPLLPPKGVLPLSSFSIVQTTQRAFVGICITDSIEIDCEGSQLYLASDVLAAMVLENWYGWKDQIDRHIFTMDGSRYSLGSEEQIGGNAKLEFLTVVGRQTVDLKRFFNLALHTPGCECGKRLIRGATLSEVQIVKERLAFALEHNHRAIRQLLGDEVFAAYFAR